MAKWSMVRAGRDSIYAEDFISENVVAIGWSELGEISAAACKSDILKKYKVDIFASPDGLGLEEPRIFVEVKHRTSTIGSQHIRSFIGGRGSNDRCLYVSTGGFTKDARYEADRSNVPLQLLGLVEL